MMGNEINGTVTSWYRTKIWGGFEIIFKTWVALYTFNSPEVVKG